MPAADAAHTHRVMRILFPPAAHRLTGEPDAARRPLQDRRGRDARHVESGTGYRAGGGERPVDAAASSAPSASCSTMVAEPTSVRRDAPETGSGCGSEPSWLDAQDMQCCGVFRWQM